MKIDFFFDILSIIIIIITLFQEDNIFGTDASLTYGPQKTINCTILRSRLRHLHKILQEFSTELWPLNYVKSVFFHNVFIMVGIL